MSFLDKLFGFGDGNDENNQRRQEYRTSLPKEVFIKINLHLGAEQHFEGQLLDLAKTGCRAVLKQLLEDQTLLNKIIQIELQYGEEKQLKCDAEIRYISYHEVEGNTIVGMRFHELTDSNTLLLAQILEKISG